MTHRIIITHTEPALADQWRDALAARLPGALVAIDDGRSRVRADFAVGWAPPADFFDRVAGLRAFFGVAAGADHLLRHPAIAGDVSRAPPLYRLEDAGMAAQMAAYCCHELTRIAQHRDRYAAQQAQAQWREWPPIEHAALGVGVFGLGVLGGAVARALCALGYPVAGYSRRARAVPGVRCLHGDALDEFLALSRVLILLAPLTAQTADCVNASLLARLPRGAWLVNVARGGLVVDDDLLAALDSGQLAGATLDVFRTEPLPAAHPFWRHPAIRITPHIAAVTLVDEGAAQVADKILVLASGGTASGRIDPARGY